MKIICFLFFTATAIDFAISDHQLKRISYLEENYLRSFCTQRSFPENPKFHFEKAGILEDRIFWTNNGADLLDVKLLMGDGLMTNFTRRNFHGSSCNDIWLENRMEDKNLRKRRDAANDSIIEKLEQKKEEVHEKLEQKKEDLNWTNIIIALVVGIFTLVYSCLLCNSTPCCQYILSKNRSCLYFLCCYPWSRCLGCSNINSTAIDDSGSNHSNSDETAL